MVGRPEYLYIAVARDGRPHLPHTGRGVTLSRSRSWSPGVEPSRELLVLFIDCADLCQGRGSQGADLRRPPALPFAEEVDDPPFAHIALHARRPGIAARTVDTQPDAQRIQGTAKRPHCLEQVRTLRCPAMADSVGNLNQPDPALPACSQRPRLDPGFRFRHYRVAFSHGHSRNSRRNTARGYRLEPAYSSVADRTRPSLRWTAWSRDVPVSALLISFRQPWRTRSAWLARQDMGPYRGNSVICRVSSVWPADLSRAVSAAPIAVAGVRTPARSGN